MRGYRLIIILDSGANAGWFIAGLFGPAIGRYPCAMPLRGLGYSL
jgi:hypothetical protein